MANKLRKMRLTSVDLVRAGANQKADICIYKGWDDDHDATPPAPANRRVSKSDPNRFDYIVEVFP